jgi:acetoin:2,6-dichlorophenolindophenol oxidoreductase subunit beta
MPKSQRKITLAESINEALVLSMKKNKNVILIGLGVDDPKGIFGTTKGIDKKFKKEKRLFDFPTAENAMTGIAIGSSLAGMKPIIVHQRVEFSLLSLEQIINQAAKWFFMNGGQKSVPLVIRLIVGRGWGQGPQHSQSLEPIFAHIPGLKVISLSTPLTAKGLLLASIEDKNPVIIFEHRWLHDIEGHVPKKYFKHSLDKANVLKKGTDITLISSSYMVIECLRSASILKKFSINAEVIDIQSLRPLDIKTLLNSVKKTKKVIIVDNGGMSFGISSEIMAKIYENLNDKKSLNIFIKRIGPPDNPIPSTRELAKYCYSDYLDIVKEVLKIFKKKNTNLKNYENNIPKDQPNKNFLGPF